MCVWGGSCDVPPSMGRCAVTGTRRRTASVSPLEAAEACLRGHGSAEELGSAHITPQRSTTSSFSSTFPPVHSVHPSAPPSFPCVGAALTTQHSPFFLHLFPFRLLSLLPKGQVCCTVIPTLFFPLSLVPSSHLISCPVLFFGGKVWCPGL